MSTANPILSKERVAEGAIAKHRIVKAGAAAGGVAQSAAASDKSYGVAAHAAATTERVRITLMGIEEIEAGATIADGDLIASDADGKAAVALTGERVIGVAQSAAASGDIFPVLLTPGLH